MDIFCMTCGTNYKGDFTNSRCPECERRKKLIKEIMVAIEQLPSPGEEKEKEEEK